MTATHWHCLVLPLQQNKTLITLKAPEASYLEVPDPDEVGISGGTQIFSKHQTNLISVFFSLAQAIGSPQYKMIVRSSTGPIDLYLLRFVLGLLFLCNTCWHTGFIFLPILPFLCILWINGKEWILWMQQTYVLVHELSDNTHDLFVSFIKWFYLCLQ